ncbi:MAG: ATP-NAD kinase family protein [Pontibacterium sp.]
MQLKIGLIVNPYAGIGGSVALKGSDGADIRDQALALGAEQKAPKRATQTLSLLQGLDIQFYTYAGEMGEQSVRAAGFEPVIVGKAAQSPSTAEDTHAAAQALQGYELDLLLFAGGDGTARDVARIVAERCPVLGIPAGVKIHSGVYALTPEAAAQVVKLMSEGKVLSFGPEEVRDLDETAFRAGRVSAKFFGELMVPRALEFVQQVKQGGQETEELVLEDIAADVIESMEPDVRYLMGSGSTVAAIMAQLGLQNTLLGVDVVENGEVIATDASAAELLALTEGYESQLVITLIGGQGHIIGRGNQQLSPPLLRRLGKERIQVVATKTKLLALNGRPLIVDSGEQDVNDALSGSIEVTTGYRDRVLYHVARF